MKNQVLQNLLRVKTFQLPGDLIVALNLVKLLADVLHRDGLIPNLRDRVCRDFARGGPLWNQVQQHAAAKNQTRCAKQDALRQGTLIFRSSHSYDSPGP